MEWHLGKMERATTATGSRIANTGAGRCSPGGGSPRRS